jgi:hypothetical protein
MGLMPQRATAGIVRWRLRRTIGRSGTPSPGVPCDAGQPCFLMWSMTWLNSSVGEKSTYWESSSASGACPGAQ